MDLGLQGKHALVTGSHRGTGREIARCLAQEGATVFVHGFSPEAPTVVAAELAASGAKAYAVSGDLTCDAGADRLLAECESLGPVSVLVNNYGIALPGRWSELDAGGWLRAYEHNTLSAVRALQRFVPVMKRQGWGRIVNVSTIGGLRPAAQRPHYYAAKAALANLTVSASKELAGTGITVNTVSPGLIRTSELEEYLRARAARKGWGESWSDIERRACEEMMPNPTGRLATMQEVARAVAFLASEGAAAINGVNLRVDGGASELAV